MKFCFDPSVDLTLVECWLLLALGASVTAMGKVLHRAQDRCCCPSFDCPSSWLGRCGIATGKSWSCPSVSSQGGDLILLSLSLEPNSEKEKKPLHFSLEIKDA